MLLCTCMYAHSADFAVLGSKSFIKQLRTIQESYGGIAKSDASPSVSYFL